MQFARTLFIVGEILVLETSLSISDSYLPRGGRVGTKRFPPHLGAIAKWAIRNTFNRALLVHWHALRFLYELQFARTPVVVGEILVLETSLSISDSYLPCEADKTTKEPTSPF